MKKRWLAIISCIVVCFAIVMLSLKGQGEKLDKEQVQSDIMLKVLARGHYSPFQLNDAFSKRTFDLFLKGLDSEKRFLLASDVNELKQYQTVIDDELRQDSTEFFDLASRLIVKRTGEVQTYTQEILAKPFNLNSPDVLEVDPEKREYAKNSAELKELWRKILKAQVLQRYLDLTGDPKQATADPAELERQARTEVSRNIKSAMTRLQDEKPEERFDRYLNAIASSFDPHTEYFPPVEQENFQITMSGTLEGIGAKLQENGEFIKVVEIVPGSPAWRQKELQAGDLILKVAQGPAEPVDITNMPVNDVVKLIRGKKGTEVRLTVKKSTGQVVVIPIVRDVVVIEETYAKSAVLTDTKTAQKYGYIYLPSFYHDFNNNNARNAASDFRNEIQKLKAQKVNGLIIDLRNNGGGALDDAIKIGGLFIKSGPIVQVKDSRGRIEVKNDPDPGIAFEKPVVVLVNSLSASASEILAAALQDYGRAVIVGSRTFGKGTVQTIYDLDQFLPVNQSSLSPLGSLKLTIQKFYRINGGSTQSKGVVPDISLPDLYSYLKVRETDLKYSLPWDTIKAASYNHWNQQYNLWGLKNRSSIRQETNITFKTINQYLVDAKNDYNNTIQSLNFIKYKKRQDDFKKATNIIDKIQVSSTRVRADSSGNIKNSNDGEWLQKIQKDAYILEGLNVLEDIKQ